MPSLPSTPLHPSTAAPWIVVTTINPPTAAIHAFQKLRSAGWRVVVVGDTKTPADWHCDGIDFLSVDSQKQRFPTLAELIPYRHYCRKNLGYLHAIAHGATLILDTDDDNIPYPNFGQNIAQTVRGRRLRPIPENSDPGGWINIYRHFTPHKNIWPRGLPLDAIQNEGIIENAPIETPALIQQYLADEDPNVDAIYRLTGGPRLNFTPNAAPVILAKGTWVPFNSQNTLFFREAFPLLYLPCFVSFRMTDIWRSFVAQIALATIGQSLSFHPATVRQVRNAHHLMQDFEDEIPGYLHNRKIMTTLAHRTAALSPTTPLAEITQQLWHALLPPAFIEPREETILTAWLAALTK